MGVDQVLQVEMVLPNGYHVKFGPTEWEDASADGFVVPRTTVVSGVCRSNPDEEDEEKWIWEACPEDFDVDFYDLWFAVRGGGGGTWGVVTSTSLQLHPYVPYKQYRISSEEAEECSDIQPKAEEFMQKYLLTPSLLNVMTESSNACGTPGLPKGAEKSLHCYEGEEVMGAWTRFTELNNLPSTCLFRKFPEAKSYPEPEALLMEPDIKERFPNNARDNPLPTSAYPGSFMGFVLIPQSFVDESEENFDFYFDIVVDFYNSHGVAISSMSDQANSLSQSHSVMLQQCHTLL